MPKYNIELIFNMHEGASNDLRAPLSEFGENLCICDYEEGDFSGKNFKINIDAEDPTLIFDLLAQFDRIRSVKVNEQARS